jgi:hypothetical protein
MVVGGKNIVSFGLSYGLIRLLTEIGYKKSICTFAAIHAFLFLLAIPVFYLAPKVCMPCRSRYSIYSPQFFHSPSLWRLRHVPNFGLLELTCLTSSYAEGMPSNLMCWADVDVYSK